MSRYHSVFLALLPILAATGCSEDGTACMEVEEDAECPAAADVSKDDVTASSCGSEVRSITGEGEYADNISWNWSDSAEEIPGCCYEVKQTKSTCVYGRPLLVDGEALLSELSADAAWAASLIPADVPDDVRAAIAARWTRAALDEHASVAAFSKVSLDLMRVGAPPELIELAHRAALDEIRHAQLGFALASAFTGSSVGPAPYPIESVDLVRGVRELAVEAAIESCMGETVAAMLAREGAHRAEDPVLKQVLEAIADDEQRHAELGWRIVAWALSQGDHEVHAAVAGVFAEALRTGIAVPLAQAEDLSRWGLLNQEDSQRVAALCLREIVLPAAKALFGGPSRPAISPTA